jgi:hypothetical protein
MLKNALCSKDLMGGERKQFQQSENSTTTTKHAANESQHEPTVEDHNNDVQYFQGDDGSMYCFNGENYFVFSQNTGQWELTTVTLVQ